MGPSLLRSLLLLLILLAAPGVRAEALVLLPGYLEDGGAWRESGVTATLEAAGWHDGGNLLLGRGGVRIAGGERMGNRRFYTVNLPSEAPLLTQLQVLEPLLAWVRAQHRDETLALAGHSAGGVLGRLYLVRHPEAGIDALVTIASPHLGTDTAELGLLAGQTPLAWLAPFVGGETLNRSQGLYYDLSGTRPGGFLDWLNHQPHPEAIYVSIVRRQDGLLGIGDVVVPPRSQDMNQVPALHGRARTWTVDGLHTLERADGKRILEALALLGRT